MAPGNVARAFVTIVGFLDHIGDLTVGFGSNLVDYGIGQNLAQLPGHFFRSCSYRFQYLRAVKKLTAYNEPEFVFFHMFPPVYVGLLFPGKGLSHLCEAAPFGSAVFRQL